MLLQTIIILNNGSNNNNNNREVETAIKVIVHGIDIYDDVYDMVVDIRGHHYFNMGMKLYDLVKLLA